MTETAGPSQAWNVQSQEVPHDPTAGEPPGDVPSFPAVFAAQFGYVWATLRRLGVKERDLEDVTQDVFLKVFDRLADFDPARPLRPWLFAFAFRVASDHRRLLRNRLELLDAQNGEPVDPAPSALERVIRAEALDLAQAALDELDLDRRAVFILHELDDCSMPEIAEALGIPLNTAYSRLRLARKQFAASARRLSLRRGEP